MFAIRNLILGQKGLEVQVQTKSVFEANPNLPRVVVQNGHFLMKILEWKTSSFWAPGILLHEVGMGQQDGALHWPDPQQVATDKGCVSSHCNLCLGVWRGPALHDGPEQPEGRVHLPAACWPSTRSSHCVGVPLLAERPGTRASTGLAVRRRVIWGLPSNWLSS